jgi:hypothetical protein
MEATLFTTLMSISNGGRVVGGRIGASLTQVFGVTKDRFDNLAYLIYFNVHIIQIFTSIT